ncbi:MAG: sigma-70 family RNA polymerase sigma factor [Deltaproteobacteria bacterium]|nr:sigma-70 family RNA polymerase sigma factor [Deltaproteobacteria bacterium]MBK9643551.1 sigma-70 family RNA polymerase sigma factor [Deltaproteobacteria bacterium]
MPASETELRTLYQRYAPPLLARCRRILGDNEEAQDIVQETFARVIRRWDEFRQEASPYTWMVRISTNLCLNRLRDHKSREAKRSMHPEAIVGDGFTAPHDHKSDEAALVRRALAEADEQTRALIIYLYFDDMTRQEAAALVGLSQPTLRKRLDEFFVRARRALSAPEAAALAVLLGALVSR